MLFRRIACSVLCAMAVLIAANLPAELGFASEIDTEEPVAAPVPAERYLLRYKFRPNDLVYYDVQQSSTQTIKSATLIDVHTNESSTRKHFRVISVDKSGAGLLELVIDHVFMRVKFGEGDPIEFNSQSEKPAPRQFHHVRDSIGKPRARIRITSNGKLKKVTLLNRSRRRIGGIGQMEQAPETDANDPSHNFLVKFPNKSIAVGETWSDRISVQVRITKSLTRPITLVRRYSLKSVKGSRATISMSTRILTPIRDPKILTQLIQRTPTGTAVFDIDRGVIVSRTTNINQRQVGGITGKSLMTVVSKRTEKLVTPEKTALRDRKPVRK